MNEKPDKPKKPVIPDAQTVEHGLMVQLAREAVEAVGADAVLVVWTKQRRRKTFVHQASIGNGLLVEGLMRWIHGKIEEADGADEDETDEEEEDDDD